MEWLVGTASKEVVEETSGKRSNKRRREDGADEEAIGPCLHVTIQVSRFRCVREVELLIILCFSRILS